MGAPADRAGLEDVLRSSQRLGFLGDRPIPEVVDHARAFGDALADVTGRVVDLGSGGGVPGLVVAFERPDLQVTLVDRRTTRTDHLRRLVGRLGWHERVSVVAADVEVAPTEIIGGPFDAAVARGFGPPERTVRAAVRVVGSGGVVVISEPPEGDRWDPEVLAAAGVVRETVEVAPTEVIGGPFDAAVARGFGPPERTVRAAVRVVGPGGVVVISEPPEGDRWDPEVLAAAGVVRETVEGPVARFRVG